MDRAAGLHGRVGPGRIHDDVIERKKATPTPTASHNFIINLAESRVCQCHKVSGINRISMLFLCH
jgi:hypothetical protein